MVTEGSSSPSGRAPRPRRPRIRRVPPDRGPERPVDGGVGAGRDRRGHRPSSPRSFEPRRRGTVHDHDLHDLRLVGEESPRPVPDVVVDRPIVESVVHDQASSPPSTRATLVLPPCGNRVRGSSNHPASRGPRGRSIVETDAPSPPASESPRSAFAGSPRGRRGHDELLHRYSSAATSKGSTRRHPSASRSKTRSTGGPRRGRRDGGPPRDRRRPRNHPVHLAGGLRSIHSPGAIPRDPRRDAEGDRRDPEMIVARHVIDRPPPRPDRHAGRQRSDAEEKRQQDGEVPRPDLRPGIARLRPDDPVATSSSSPASRATPLRATSRLPGFARTSRWSPGSRPPHERGEPPASSRRPRDVRVRRRPRRASPPPPAPGDRSVPPFRSLEEGGPTIRPSPCQSDSIHCNGPGSTAARIVVESGSVADRSTGPVWATRRRLSAGLGHVIRRRVAPGPWGRSVDRLPHADGAPSSPCSSRSGTIRITRPVSMRTPAAATGDRGSSCPTMGMRLRPPSGTGRPPR